MRQAFCVWLSKTVFLAKIQIIPQPLSIIRMVFIRNRFLNKQSAIEGVYILGNGYHCDITAFYIISLLWSYVDRKYIQCRFFLVNIYFLCKVIHKLCNHLLSRTLRILDNALRIPSTGREPLRASQPADSPDKICSWPLSGSCPDLQVIRSALGSLKLCSMPEKNR